MAFMLCFIILQWHALVAHCGSVFTSSIHIPIHICELIDFLVLILALSHVYMYIWSITVVQIQYTKVVKCLLFTAQKYLSNLIFDEIFKIPNIKTKTKGMHV